MSHWLNVAYPRSISIQVRSRPTCLLELDYNRMLTDCSPLAFTKCRTQSLACECRPLSNRSGAQTFPQAHLRTNILRRARPYAPMSAPTIPEIHRRVAADEGGATRMSGGIPWITLVRPQSTLLVTWHSCFVIAGRLPRLLVYRRMPHCLRFRYEREQGCLPLHVRVLPPHAMVGA